MIILVSESNPKIQCQYVLLKAEKYFCWISYETLFKSFTRKVNTFIIFSQRNPNFFFRKKRKNKTNKKQY